MYLHGLFVLKTLSRPSLSLKLARNLFPNSRTLKGESSHFRVLKRQN